MKTQIIIFCFISILLLLTSLNHLRLLNRCNNNNNVLKEVLNDKYTSNIRLIGQIFDKQMRLLNLRKISAEKINNITDKIITINKL
jgi:hypothetical protein